MFSFFFDKYLISLIIRSNQEANMLCTFNHYDILFFHGHNKSKEVFT